MYATFVRAVTATAFFATLVIAQPLRPRSDLVTGSLDNGLSYVVLRHDNPPDRAAAYLHVSAGSLNETDDQRGLAHFLEHMAFNGSENFDRNEVIDFFESIGLTFGRHQNAFTSFDQTTYSLELPDAAPGTLDKAFLFFSDVAFGLTLDPEQIESERPIILEEKRTRAGPQMRVQEHIFKNISPGSRFGERLPIGTLETIRTMNREDFVEFYRTWYVPSNITLLIVADADPDMIVDRIRANFSRGRTVPRPEDLDPAVRPYTETHAIVAADEEIRDAEVSIVRISAPRPPVRTEQAFRDSLIDSMATLAFNRRLEAAINEGRVRFLQGSAFAGDLFNAFRLAQVSASGEPAAWRDMLRDLATELQRARLHAFSDREIDAVRSQLIASAERAVERESTLPARQILQQLNTSVAEGEPFLAAAERLRLIRKYADAVTPRDIADRFADMFRTDAVAFIATLPSGADVPTEEELIALGSEVLSVTPDADFAARAEARLMDQLPQPASLTASALHEATGVWSAELSNNVTLHHRFMDERKDSVTVTITLTGGELLEPEDRRGVTRAALLAWQRPATASHTSTGIRDLMTGTKVDLSASMSNDAIVLTVSGSPADLESGLQLAHLLLTEPRVEIAAFDQWRRSTLQEIEGRKLQPIGVIQELIPETIAPGDHRFRPLEKADVEALSRDGAQAWLETLIRESPIEVAVVGDIDGDAALPLIARYLGSLPSRDPVSPFPYAERRSVDRPEGPLLGRREVRTQTPMGIVLSGFFGADQRDYEDARTLSAAAQILTTRMLKRIREQEQLVYSISAQSQPGVAYPGYGLFFAVAPTDPASVDRLASVIDEMFTGFAAEGPTSEEVSVARRQIANRLDEQIQEPAYWTNVLADLRHHDRSLDRIASIREWFDALTPERIREVFTRYYSPEGRVTIIVTPAPTPESPGG